MEIVGVGDRRKRKRAGLWMLAIVAIGALTAVPCALQSLEASRLRAIIATQDLIISEQRKGAISLQGLKNLKPNERCRAAVRKVLAESKGKIHLSARSGHITGIFTRVFMSADSELPRNGYELEFIGQGCRAAWPATETARGEFTRLNQK